MNNVFVFLLSLILPRRFWYRRFYLHSRHWQQIRRRWGQRGYDLHHLTYRRLWRERRGDLQLLTRAEHRKRHA